MRYDEKRKYPTESIPENVLAKKYLSRVWNGDFPMLSLQLGEPLPDIQEVEQNPDKQGYVRLIALAQGNLLLDRQGAAYS